MPHPSDDVSGPVPLDDPDAARLHVVSGVVPACSGVSLHHTRHGDELEIEIVAEGDDPTGTGSVDAAVRAIETITTLPAAAGARVHLAAEHAPDRLAPLPEAVADAAGFSVRRDLLQLRRPLPFPADHPARSASVVPTRTLQPGTADEEAWVRVNNRAFATHPDQGRESVDTLHDRMAEPWFDPSGFLVADDEQRPGELAGFCWTKVHLSTETDPMLGEIYVIGVDPSHRGEGLGPSFVIAGLDHLAARGIGTANLYVDAGNEPAVRLYDRLGFHTHARRRVYTAAAATEAPAAP